MTRNEISRFIIEKIGMFPYNLVENNNNKLLRISMFLLGIITLILTMVLFFPILIVLMIGEILEDV